MSSTEWPACMRTSLGSNPLRDPMLISYAPERRLGRKCRPGLSVSKQHGKTCVGGTKRRDSGESVDLSQAQTQARLDTPRDALGFSRKSAPLWLSPPLPEVL